MDSFPGPRPVITNPVNNALLHAFCDTGTGQIHIEVYAADSELGKPDSGQRLRHSANIICPRFSTFLYHRGLDKREGAGTAYRLQHRDPCAGRQDQCSQPALSRHPVHDSGSAGSARADGRTPHDPPICHDDLLQFDDDEQGSVIESASGLCWPVLIVDDDRMFISAHLCVEGC